MGQSRHRMSPAKWAYDPRRADTLMLRRCCLRNTSHLPQITVGVADFAGLPLEPLQES
jgi:hypothetical protein